MQKTELKNLLRDLTPVDEQVSDAASKIEEILSDISSMKEELASAIEERDEMYSEAMEVLFTNLDNKADKYFKELKQSIDKKEQELSLLIKSIEDKSDVSDLDIKRQVKEAKSELKEYISSLSQSIETQKKDFTKSLSILMKEIKQLNDESSEKISKTESSLRKEILEKFTVASMNKGGGTMPFQVSVDGVVATKRYADINLISGSGVTFSVSNNNTTKRTEITATAQTGIVETPTGAIDGTNTVYTFTVAPRVIVVDQSRVMVNGNGYTLVGLIATLDVAPTFSIFSI